MQHAKGKSIPRRTLRNAVMLAVAICTEAVIAQTTFTIEQPGPDGDPTDAPNSYIEINATGMVAGQGAIWISDQLGWIKRTAWLFDGISTTMLGLTGGIYTGSQGHEKNEVFGLNNAGQVLGRATEQGSSNDYTSWLFDGVETVIVGPLNRNCAAAQLPGLSNYESSYPVDLNDAGVVIGWSKFCGSASYGTHAWIDDGVDLTMIGFTDAAHTASTSYFDTIQNSQALALNESGQAIGYSVRYLAGVQPAGFHEPNETAWFFDGIDTLEIGFNTGMYLAVDGTRASRPVAINDAGLIAGWSRQYDSGSVAHGETAWVYDSATATHTIILPDCAACINPLDGSRHTTSTLLNEQGFVAGTAKTYDELGNSTGVVAWLYDGTETIPLGLTDASHTNSSGSGSSQITHINSSGQVAGKSYRYSENAASTTVTLWFYDGETTHVIWPYGSWAQNSESSGYINALTDAGEVIGNKFIKEDRWHPYSGETVFTYTPQQGLSTSIADDFSSYYNETGFTELRRVDHVSDSGHMIIDGYRDAGWPSTGALLMAPTANVDIEIKPWDNANEISPDSDEPIIALVLGASIASGASVDFDAAQINPATLRFGPAKAAISGAQGVIDLNGDGIQDYAGTFATQDTGIFCADTEATLIGQTYSGLRIHGTDNITTVDCEVSGCHP